MPPKSPIIEVSGNHLEIFTESSCYLSALTADIRAAQQRVWIESYTVYDDQAIAELVDALCERAAAGVDCRLIYDAVGSFSTPRAFFSKLQEAGGRVFAYRPLSKWWWRSHFLQRFQRRNHRKLAIIDESISYFGGMNLIDLGGSGTPPTFEPAAAPGTLPWRDLHVRLEGTATSNVAAAFLSLWPSSKGEQKMLLVNPPVREILNSKSEAIFFVDSRPRKIHRRPGPFFLALIQNANSRITFAMAYFLPFGGVLRALRRATARGVIVEVIVPAETDMPLVKWAAQHMYDRLLKSGILIYERQDQMLHSKAMVIDDEWSIVGSCNFDPRSLLINIEFFSIIRSARFASAIAEILAHERNNSVKVVMDEHQERGFLRRLLERLAWTMRRWL